MHLNEMGEEVVSSEPIAVNVKGLRRPNEREDIRAMLMGVLRESARMNGVETPEEADDFAVEEYEPRSVYEVSLDRELDGYEHPAPPAPSPARSPEPLGAPAPAPAPKPETPPPALPLPPAPAQPQ